MTKSRPKQAEANGVIVIASKLVFSLPAAVVNQIALQVVFQNHIL